AGFCAEDPPPKILPIKPPNPPLDCCPPPERTDPIRSPIPPPELCFCCPKYPMTNGANVAKTPLICEELRPDLSARLWVTVSVFFPKIWLTILLPSSDPP